MYVDIAAIILGDVIAPEPYILANTEGCFVFYSGQFNLIFGDTESGKTWLCLTAVADVLHRGGRAAMIDLDHNGAASIVQRLRGLGVGDDVLTDQQRFRLAEPYDDLELKAVVTDLTVFEPDAIVIDSLGEVLPLFRYKSNDADDFTLAHSNVIKPLTRCGAAVLVVDHLAKNQDSRNFGPTGTPAKLRAVGGIALRVTAEEPFKPGEGGSAKLELYKDRHGGVRKQFPKAEGKPVIGTFTISDLGDELAFSIEPGLTTPMARQKRINDEQAKLDAAALAEVLDLDLTVRSVREILKCGQDRAQRAIAAYRVQNSIRA